MCQHSCVSSCVDDIKFVSVRSSKLKLLDVVKANKLYQSANTFFLFLFI